MANQSPEPNFNKDLLEFLYLKHGLNLNDNKTSIRGAKYDGLVIAHFLFGVTAPDASIFA